MDVLFFHCGHEGEGESPVVNLLSTTVRVSNTYVLLFLTM